MPTYSLGGCLVRKDVSKPADFSPHATQFFLDPLVSAIDVVDAVEDRLAFGDHGRKDERSGSAQVGAHYRRGRERRLAAYGCSTPIHLDVRPHAGELLDMHEAVLKYVLHYDGRSIRLRGQSHVLRLHIRGEAGILLGGDIRAAQIAFAAHPNRVALDIHTNTAFLQFGNNGAQMRRIALGHAEIASGDGSCDEECAGFDAVRIDTMACAVELLDTTDANDARSSALNLCPHGYEHCRKIGHFGLARTILHHCFTVRKHGCHQQVFRAGYGDLVEQDVRAFQPLRARLQVAMLLRDCRAHRFESLDVQIDGTTADGAPAGHRNTGDSGAGNKWAENER